MRLRRRAAQRTLRRKIGPASRSCLNARRPGRVPMSPTFQPAIASGHSSIAASWHGVRRSEVGRQATRKRRRAARRRARGDQAPRDRRHLRVERVDRQSLRAPEPLCSDTSARQLQGMGNRCHYQYTGRRRAATRGSSGDSIANWKLLVSRAPLCNALALVGARRRRRKRPSAGRPSPFRARSAGLRRLPAAAAAASFRSRRSPATAAARCAPHSRPTEPRIIVFEVGGVIDLDLQHAADHVAERHDRGPDRAIARHHADPRRHRRGHARRDPAAHPRAARRSRASRRAEAGARTRSRRRPARTTSSSTIARSPGRPTRTCPPPARGSPARRPTNGARARRTGSRSATTSSPKASRTRRTRNSSTPRAR